MKKALAICVSGWLAWGCTGAGPKTTGGPKDPEPSMQTTTDATPEPMEIDILEDTRRAGPGFDRHASHPDWQVRLRAAEAIGRIGAPSLAPHLIDLLEDRESAVRDGAAFAAGLYGPQMTEDLRRKLLGRLQKETRAEGKVVLLEALGKTGSTEEISTIAEFTENPDPSIRQAALKALGLSGIAGVELSPAQVARIAHCLTDSNESVRLMAAFALYRLSEKNPIENAVLKALKLVAQKDKSFEVQAYALRAFAKRGGRVTEPLVRGALKSPDHAVSATGVSLIDFAPESDRCALVQMAITEIAGRLTDEAELLGTSFLRTVRAALTRAYTCSGKDLQKPLVTIENIAKQGPAESAGTAQILCQIDLLLGSNDIILTSCDPSRPHVGKRYLIQRLGTRSQNNEESLATLRSFIDDGDSRVAVSAIETLASLGGKGASESVLDALKHKNPLCVAAALDGIAAYPEHFKHNEKQILESIDDVIDRFSPFRHAYAPLISATMALESLALPGSEPLLRQLLADGRPAIRQAVLKTYRSMPALTIPAGLPELTPTNAITQEQRNTWKKLKATAHVSTNRGVFSFSLLSAKAPVTVGRFVALATDGYYDNTEIHRVVPNFVVQAGDPTGTGQGDPGYAIRCEVTPTPYRRGIVGMALSGKDTGGSQFFVTLSRQPHLDGNYTAFGEIVHGMDVVDVLEEGDQILGITIEK